LEYAISNEIQELGKERRVELFFHFSEKQVKNRILIKKFYAGLALPDHMDKRFGGMNHKMERFLVGERFDKERIRFLFVLFYLFRFRNLK
jgi:hypothetical protein